MRVQLAESDIWPAAMSLELDLQKIDKFKNCQE